MTAVIVTDEFVAADQRGLAGDHLLKSDKVFIWKTEKMRVVSAVSGVIYLGIEMIRKIINQENQSGGESAGLAGLVSFGKDDFQRFRFFPFMKEIPRSRCRESPVVLGSGGGTLKALFQETNSFTKAFEGTAAVNVSCSPEFDAINPGCVKWGQLEDDRVYSVVDLMEMGLYMHVKAKRILKDGGLA